MWSSRAWRRSRPGWCPMPSGRRPLLEREPYTQHEERLMIAEVLIHHLDVMRFLCGELRVVAARAARTVPDVRRRNGGSHLPGNGIRRAGRSDRHDGGGRVSGASAGSAWKLSAARRAPRSRTPCCACTARHRAASPTIPQLGYQASFDGVIAHFVDCLETGAPFETDPADNLETLRLVEDAYWAAGLQRLRSNA